MIMPAAVAPTALLTTSPTPTPTPTDLTGSLATGNIGPGWVAGLIVLAVIVATVLLMISMRHQMRKVTFVEEPEPGVKPGSERPVWPARPAPRQPAGRRGDSRSPRP